MHSIMNAALALKIALITNITMNIITITAVEDLVVDTITAVEEEDLAVDITN